LNLSLEKENNPRRRYHQQQLIFLSQVLFLLLRLEKQPFLKKYKQRNIIIDKTMLSRSATILRSSLLMGRGMMLRNNVPQQTQRRAMGGGGA
jgi:hypothetical protein